MPAMYLNLTPPTSLRYILWLLTCKLTSQIKKVFLVTKSIAVVLWLLRYNLGTIDTSDMLFPAQVLISQFRPELPNKSQKLRESVKKNK